MASGSRTNVKHKKKWQKVSDSSAYSELEGLLSNRNKSLHTDDNLESCPGHEHYDVDLTKLLQTVPEKKNPNKRLQRNEDVMESFVIGVKKKVKQASAVEKKCVIKDDDDDDGPDIGVMMTNLHKLTANVFKRIINVQESFNECLTNNTIVLPDDIKKKTIEMQTRVVEKTCALQCGIEAVSRCPDKTLREHIDKDLCVQTRKEFKKSVKELKRGIISQVFEDGVKSSKNHVHLLATQHAAKKYNKHSDELTMDIVGEKIDPYTKKPITKPVINTICNHVYDQGSIELMFRDNNFIRCPYIGCSNKYTTKNNLRMTSEPEDI